MSTSTPTRHGEEADGKTLFRSERMSCVNGAFYFVTREGTMEGPFASREEAEKELAYFIRMQHEKSIYPSTP